MSNDVLVCGSVAFDTITLFEGHFKDHILAEHIKSLSVSFFVPTMRKEYGGCAGNIAYNLRMLGGNPVPVATVGKDAREYLQRMRDMGIDTRAIRVLPDAFTPQCHITTDLDGNQIAAFHPGAMMQSAENDISREKAVWAIVAPDSKDGMFTHAENLNKAGIPFIFDLGQAMPLFDKADLERMLGLANVLTVNDYEASVIEQRLEKSMAQIAGHLEAVVVTRGAEGSDLYHDGQQISIEAVKAEAVTDPTGCGDSHRAGLLYGLSLGWGWEDCCRLGSLMGAIKIASQGPQNHFLSREEISSRLMSAFGTALPAL
ncbi:carbohydrate kinase family protein [Advenella alkanexedens]|jgi:adenosine kinase|uniref:Carbohydrate kinase family protein n=1 Tax=Advenella alkanexedens TaxID=1481665 RepID=A0ABS6NLL1_9BURK|nr:MULTISPECIES: carbohydrate kinase family protein [Advenella]MBV4396435.1 carbohydrate kinase family protein [Advenella alkanexedens]NLN68639.1 carbohydrate kinase family protein [Alcaligenaceae bacterium]